MKISIIFLMAAAALAHEYDLELGPYFEGDIILAPGQIIGKGALLDERYRWPDNTVVYTLDSELTQNQRNVLAQAFEEYERNSCIRFKERTNERDYVFIDALGGGTTTCSSNVGYLGSGQQKLNLSDRCFNVYGTILHELLHTIGFFHEQSRPDRDDFILVVWDNIIEGYEGNFLKYNENQVTTMNTPYDYGSMMHYGAYGFAIDSSQPTLIPLDPNVGLNDIGQRANFSAIDLQELNLVYGCEKFNLN